MPELAEVEYYRRQWDAGLRQKVVRVQLHSEKRIFRGSNPRELVRALTGSRFVHSSSWGKQMLFEFSGGNWIGIHLGMTGKLRTEAPGFRAEKHDHLVLQQAKRALVFRDARLFGRVRFHNGKSPPPWWRAGAPDLYSRAFHERFLDAFLKRHARAPIKSVLLLQSGFAGIGNWMADEILWRAKIAPLRVAGTLSAADRARLFREPDVVARNRCVITFRTGIRRSAAQLVDPSKVETQRALSTPPGAVAQSDDWRANDGVVPTMSDNVDRDLVKAGRA